MNSNKMIYWHEGLFLSTHHFQYLDKSIKDSKFFLLDKIFKYNYGFIDYEIDLKELDKGQFKLKSCELILENTYINYPENTNLISRNITESDINIDSSRKLYLGIKKEHKDNVDIEIKSIRELKKKNTRYTNIETELEKVSSLYELDDRIDFTYVKYTVQFFLEEELDALSDYNLIPICVINNKQDKYSLDPFYIPPLINLNKKSINSLFISDIIYEIKKSINTLEKDRLKNKNITLLVTLNPFIIELENHLLRSYTCAFEIYECIKKIISILIVFTKSYTLEDIIGENNISMKYNHDNLYKSFEALKVEIKKVLKDILDVKIQEKTEFTFNFNKKNDFYYINIASKYFEKDYSFYIELISENIDEIKKKINYIKISNKELIENIVFSSITDIKFNIKEPIDLKFPTNSNALYLKLNTDDKSWKKIRDTKNLSFFLDQIEVKKENLIIVEKK